MRRGRPLRIVHGADTDGRALYLSAETIERLRAAGRELLDDSADTVAGLHRAGGLHGTVVVGNRGPGRLQLAHAPVRRQRGTHADGVDEVAGRHVETLLALTDTTCAEFPDLTVENDAEKGISVAGVLVEASRHADLLVMGGRRAPTPLGLRPCLGRATRSLLHHAQCPVLLVRRFGSDFGSTSSTATREQARDMTGMQDHRDFDRSAAS
ncbi:universal stress protein [Streptomyces sp. NPDC085524]|uniref:universal stress protein n=1 Tax=Streptomyces sp. NPDC085524 TaxID=3365728 RepID=UPI0037D1AFB3